MKEAQGEEGGLKLPGLQAGINVLLSTRAARETLGSTLDDPGGFPEKKRPAILSKPLHLFLGGEYVRGGEG